MKRNELDELKIEGRLSNNEILNGSVTLSTNQILEALNEDQYETITLQWAYYHIKKNYEKVYQLGGAGDKGRDICAVIDGQKDKWDLYQCKHYAAQLSPTMIYVEMGKLCYYTFNKDYSIPQNYYFVSPKGIGSELERLLKNETLFKEKLLENWDKYCKGKIISRKQINLEGKLLDYFNRFDFSIVDWIEPNEFIDHFRSTPFFSRWFGGGLNKKRAILPSAHPVIQDEELIYINELLKAYGDHKNIDDFRIEHLEKLAKLKNHFNRQRDSFYIADSLDHFSRDALPYGNTSFADLKEEVYQLIIDIVESDFNTGYDRLKATIQEAKKGLFDNNPLKEEINIQDKVGICHHLINDEKIYWIENE